MKKKIFFIMSTDDFSGAESVNFSIIDGLKHKYDFYWVSKKGNINKFLKEKKIKWIEIESLTLKEVNRIIKQHNPDLLHATDFKASVITSLTNTKVPIISHLHNNALWLKKINIKSIAFLFASFKINKILTVSSSIEKEYIFSKFIAKKIQNISNPVSRDKILSKVKDKDYIKKYDICCLARLDSPKNPQKFIRIIAELKKDFPNIKAIWIGKGELLEECLLLSKQLNVTKNIKFIGFKSNPYRYMASSKMLLLTSDWEGYGLAAYEALSLGLPCIVSKVGGLVDIVTEECGSLCLREEEYIKNLKDILLSEKKYQKLSKAAINRSKKLNNYNQYIKIIDKIYKEWCKNEISNKS